MWNLFGWIVCKHVKPFLINRTFLISRKFLGPRAPWSALRCTCVRPFHETRVKARANRLLRISDTTIVILDLTILTRAMQVRRNRIAQQHAIKVDDFQFELVFGLRGEAISPFSRPRPCQKGFFLSASFRALFIFSASVLKLLKTVKAVWRLKEKHDEHSSPKERGEGLKIEIRSRFWRFRFCRLSCYFLCRCWNWFGNDSSRFRAS